jgi:hypothetical protein
MSMEISSSAILRVPFRWVHNTHVREVEFITRTYNQDSGIISVMLNDTGWMIGIDNGR